MTKPAHVPAVGVLVVALSSLLGCGGGSNITRTGRTPVVQRADGRLNRDPDPVSIAQIKRLPRDSPQSVVLQVWFYAQWGSAPSIVRFYDPRVVSTIGAATIANAFARERDDMLGMTPRLGSVVRGPGGRLVTVTLLSATAAPEPESYLLRRRGGVWRIVHDSVLEHALRDYVQVKTQQRVAPGAPRADPRAVAAGVRAATRYRRIYLSRGAPEPRGRP
jgi:hypothetical protein